VSSTDTGLEEGEAVSVALFPWEVTLSAATPEGESAMNHVVGEIVTITEFGNRARVTLAIPQRLTAEVTSASVERLALRPGVRIAASWKATATRLSPRPR
jgi:molybdopterin-binding protein